MFRNWSEVAIALSAVFTIVFFVAYFALAPKPKPLQLIEQCGPTTRAIVDPNDEPDLYRVQVAQTRSRTVTGGAVWIETFVTRNERHARAICRHDCPDGNACDIYARGSH